MAQRRGSTPTSAARASKRFPSRWKRCAARSRHGQSRRRIARRHQRQHPSEWSAAFSKLLQHAGWPGDRPLSPAEHQTVEHWKNLLSELAVARCRAAAPHLRPSAPAAAAASPTIDASPRATKAHPFRSWTCSKPPDRNSMRLWIAGLHGGVWPEAPRPNPFLPLSLQRSAGMPHSSPERELALRTSRDRATAGFGDGGRVQLSRCFRARKSCGSARWLTPFPKSPAVRCRISTRPFAEFSRRRFRWRFSRWGKALGVALRAPFRAEA